MRAERVNAAASAAAAAERWLRPTSVRSRIEDAGLIAEAETLERTILGSERLCRRVFDPLPRLFDIFRDTPELGVWLSSADSVRSLCLHSGAHRHGGALRDFIRRQHVEAIVSRIGWPVYRYALTREHTSLVLSPSPEPILDIIEYDGVRAVSRYLSDVLGDLYPDVADAAGLPEAPPSHACPGPSASIDVAAVISEVKHDQCHDADPRRPAEFARPRGERRSGASRRRSEAGQLQPQ